MGMICYQTLKKIGSPVLGGKKPKHDGQYVHKEGKGPIRLVFESSFPLKTVDPKDCNSPWMACQIRA